MIEKGAIRVNGIVIKDLDYKVNEYERIGIIMNSIILIGRLTKDPEIRYTQSGTAVSRFSIAVNRQFAKKDAEITADFFSIVIWGKIAEACNNYLSKGKQVALRGRLQNNNYTDKNGNKQYSVEIIAEEVQFIDYSDKGQNNQFDAVDEDGYRAFQDEDVPF